MSIDKVLTFLGRTFICSGILVFLFVGYQLWGTNIAESRNQNRLEAQAARDGLATKVPTVAESAASTSPQPDNTPAPPPAPVGDTVAVISIPKISLQKAVVEGTGVPDLKKGPGHYVGTPLPGQPGNAALAGHRTTYGAPFGDLGELAPGDEIDVSTRQGVFHYKMTAQKIVDPSDVSVLAPTKDNRLTLTTCHPKYSASKRMVVIAALDTRPATATVAPTKAPTNPKNALQPAGNAAANLSGADLSGTATDKTPAFIWGFAAALVALGTWIVGRLWRRWTSYLIGAPIFLLVLFVFFENFSRLLPANA